MNRFVAAAFAGCLALASATAWAQNLNKAEEGRAAVASCYARCVDGTERTRLAVYARFDRLTDLLISDEFFALNDASQDIVLDDEKTYACLLGQDYVRSLDACQAGCVDLEAIYGVSTSNARERFRNLLTRESAALREVGLWNGYRNSPDGGSREFERACAAYWQDDGGSASAPSHAKPRQLLGDGRQALQRRAHVQDVAGGEASSTPR